MFDEKEAKKLLLIAEDKQQAAKSVLKRAVILRESIYRLFKSLVEGWQPEPDDFEKLNRELSLARRRQNSQPSKTGLF